MATTAAIGLGRGQDLLRISHMENLLEGESLGGEIPVTTKLYHKNQKLQKN